MAYEILIVIYLIIALALIGLILIQQGKGADMGASFGAGSSATIFGSSGSGNFLTRTTTWLAIAFFAISLILGNMTASKVKATDEWNDLSDTAVEQKVAEKTKSAEAIKSEKPANTDVPAGDNKTASDSDVPN